MSKQPSLELKSLYEKLLGLEAEFRKEAIVSMYASFNGIADLFEDLHRTLPRDHVELPIEVLLQEMMPFVKIYTTAVRVDPLQGSTEMEEFKSFFANIAQTHCGESDRFNWRSSQAFHVLTGWTDNRFNFSKIRMSKCEFKKRLGEYPNLKLARAIGD